MAEPTETIVITGAKEAVEAIRSEIDTQQGSQSRLTERKNLDGSTAEWIMIATLIAQALPHVLGFVRDYLGAKQVKKIKVGNWEVENPTPEMVDRLLAMMTPVESKPEQRDD